MDASTILVVIFVVAILAVGGILWLVYRRERGSRSSFSHDTSMVSDDEIEDDPFISPVATSSEIAMGTPTWFLRWNPPTVGTPPIAYKYVIRYTGGRLSTQGTTSNTFIPLVLVRNINVAYTATITPANQIGNGPSTSYTYAIPGGVPNVSAVIPAPGNRTIFQAIPNTIPPAYFLYFVVILNNTIITTDDIDIGMVNNTTGARATPVKVDLMVLPGDLPPLRSLLVAFCDPTNSSACAATQRVLVGHSITLNISAKNMLGAGTNYTQTIVVPSP